VRCSAKATAAHSGPRSASILASRVDGAHHDRHLGLDLKYTGDPGDLLLGPGLDDHDDAICWFLLRLTRSPIC
jgi:hypothetical protein